MEDMVTNTKMVDMCKRLVLTITVPRVDMHLLKKQRDAVLRSIKLEESFPLPDEKEIELMNGLVNLLDAMIALKWGRSYDLPPLRTYLDTGGTRCAANMQAHLEKAPTLAGKGGCHARTGTAGSGDCGERRGARAGNL
jgi:hypothetical protein